MTRQTQSNVNTDAARVLMIVSESSQTLIK